MKFDDIGSTLRDIRHRSGKTLTALEEESGYSRTHICSMEHGRRMSVFSLCYMLKVYGYEIEFVKKGKK